MQDGKKRVMVALDAELLDRFDALCRVRGQHRAHAIEAMMRRSLKRQAKSEQQAEQDPLDPDRMIRQAQALQEAARRQEDVKFDEGEFLAQPVLLALATEIALKAWHCRDRGRRVDGHDLVELFDALSEDTQAQLQARLPEGPWPLGARWSDLSGNPFGGGMRTVLKFHRDTFKDWRYSYEKTVLFAWTPQLDEALTAIIETFSPPPVVRLPGLGNMAR